MKNAESDENANVELLKSHMSPELIAKLAEYTKQYDADAVIHAQDVSKYGIESLIVLPMGKDDMYLVKYKWSPGSNYTSIPVRATDTDGKFTILDISPEDTDAEGNVSLNEFSQSIDEKIGNAMNASDWFALDSLYSATPKDSIQPFLEIFSRCLIGNRLNRTDVSIPAFQELLNSQQLDLGNLVSSVLMFGMDLSREGYNTQAASMINSIVAQTKQYLDSATVDVLTASANYYSALAGYKPYQIEFPKNDEAVMPFSIVPVGPKEKESVLMHLTNSTINGIEADITFDTGAGTNVVSHEMAEKYDLIPLEGTKITVAGVSKSDGYIAIAKELKLGNIIVKDVPFVVASFSSHNEEADKYIDCFNIVIGSELMLRLKDLTLDFSTNRIVVPKEAAPRKNIAPNMCFSSGMNLLTKGAILGSPTIMCLDSGDASFGSLSHSLYEAHKEYVVNNGRLDSVRAAGLGGFVEQPCYYVPGMAVTIGGNAVMPTELVVKTQTDQSVMDYDANIGLRTLMLFSKVHFNMVDFVVTTEK